MIHGLLLFFVSGYGNISPATDGGQIFAVCFAVLGIPLFLIVLGAIGEKLNNMFTAMQDCCCKCCKTSETDSPRLHKFFR